MHIFSNVSEKGPSPFIRFDIFMCFCHCYWHSFVVQHQAPFLWIWQGKEFMRQSSLDLFLTWCQKCQPHIKELSKFIPSYFKPQWNSTLTFIFCSQFGWSPRRQPIKRLLNWNYPISKYSLFTSQVFPSVSLSLRQDLSLSFVLLLPSLSPTAPVFLTLYFSLFSSSFLQPKRKRALFSFWSPCWTWEEGLLMNFCKSLVGRLQDNSSPVARLALSSVIFTVDSFFGPVQTWY